MSPVDVSSFAMSPEIIILLFVTGLAAGFVDSIAGGGGLITLPVLLSVGLPPQLALGTNKLQGSFGTLSAAYNFIRKKQVVLKEAVTGVLFTLIGAEPEPGLCSVWTRLFSGIWFLFC
ncbi:MAG: TSUP family transporter [Desulfobacterales bacterium]